MHAPTFPGILTGNTLQGLVFLQDEGLLPPDIAEQLADDYAFLRRIEHALQVLHDRQTYTVPEDPDELQALARRVLGAKETKESFLQRLNSCFGRVFAAHQKYLHERVASS